MAAKKKTKPSYSVLKTAGIAFACARLFCAGLRAEDYSFTNCVTQAPVLIEPFCDGG
jgi:hypothetical protein